MKATPPFRMGLRNWSAAFLGLAVFATVNCPHSQAETSPLEAPAATAPSPEPAGFLEAETTAVRIEPNPVIDALDRGFADVYQAAAPAVVVVEVQRGGPDLSGYGALQSFLFGSTPDEEEWRTTDQGSGMLIRSDGYVMTNSHVLGRNGWYFVVLKDGRRLPAKLIGRDDNSDIAVLKIEGREYPYLEFAEMDQVRVGQFACAIGAPYELTSSFTVGWVSGINRNKLEVGRWGANPLYENYLQTDASINPGNSGGPLLDIRGRVIGMNTMIHGINTGLGFAIPSDILKWVSDQIILKGKVSRPWLGISIETLTENRNADHPKNGVLVKTVIPDAPAYLADVRADDVILAVDGEQVRTDRELQRAIFYKQVGEKVTLQVWRNGNRMELDVTTSEMDSGQLTQTRVDYHRREETQPEELVDEDLGLTLGQLNEELANKLNLDHKNSGVVILDVSPGSPADTARCHAGDVVLSVEEVEIGTLAEFREQIPEELPSDGITLLVRRGDESIALTLY